MNNQTYIGKGWITVPEAKLGPNDEILGWAAYRDIWFFAQYAQVEIKIDSNLTHISTTNFVVKGTETNVNIFQNVVARAVSMHNQQRFPNMRQGIVTWDMKITRHQGN